MKGANPHLTRAARNVGLQYYYVDPTTPLLPLIMEVIMQQIAPVILILVSVLFVIIGFIQKLRAGAASKWPSTSGVMLKSELFEHVTKTKTATNRISTFSSYEPLVEYQYTVDENVLTGKRITFGLTRLPLEKAQEFVEKHPVNAEVPVYYNPKNAKDSRLDVAAAGATPSLIIGIITAVAGAIWLVITLL
jgi:hypothetical protein